MDIRLEKWSFAFAKPIAEGAKDARVSRFLRDSFPYPYTEEDALAFIRFACAESARGDYYRAIVVDGTAAGAVAVTRGKDVFQKSGELGYWLSPAYWGRGVMTAAVRAACADVFAGTDIVRIYAEPFAVNTASCKVLEKCGFAREGVKQKSVYKRGKFFDSVMYALIKGSGYEDRSGQ